MSDISRFEIPLESNLNTDTVNQEIAPIGTTGDHIRNTGILNDGGLTNIKEITVDDSATADQVYWTKGGKKVRSRIRGAGDRVVLIDDIDRELSVGANTYKYIGNLDKYLDAVGTTDGKIVAISYSATDDAVYVHELDESFTVLRSKTDAVNSFGSGGYLVRIIKAGGISYDTFTGIYSYSLDLFQVQMFGFPRYNISLTNGNGGIFPQAFTTSSGVNRFYISNIGGVPYWKRSTDGAPLAIAGIDAGYNNMFAVLGTQNVMLTGDYFAQVGKATGLTKKIYRISLDTLTTDYTSPSATDSIISCGPGWQVIKSGLDGGTGAILRTVQYSNSLGTTFPASSPPAFRPNIMAFNSGAITSGASLAGLTPLNGFSILTPLGDFARDYVPSNFYNALGANGLAFYVYRSEDESLRVIKVGSVSNLTEELIISDVSDRYLITNSDLSNNIIDTISAEIQTGASLDTGTEIPAYSANTQSSKLFRSPVAESYNSPIFNNADITTIRSTLYKDFAYYKDGTFVGGNQNLAGTSYLAPVNLPPPITSVFKNGVIKMPGQTAIQTPNFCGYRIENVLQGEWDMFTLLGQLYAFDGTDIYSLLMDGEILADKNKVAVASGLRFLAVSTDTAYFYSTFDNSIWSFDGGRAVTKIVKLNRKGSIVEGAWNTSNNELVVRTTTELLHVRDGIITESPLPFADFEMQESRDGVYYVDGAVSKRYDYFTGTVQPLDWQSAYFGLQKNQTMLVNQYDIALSSPTKETTTIKATISTITDSGIQTQEKTYTITPEMWGTENYTRLRMIPAQQYVLASSIRLQTDQNIVILNVDLLYKPYGTAVVSAKRSL